MPLLLATHNPGKRREFQALLAGLAPGSLRLPADLGLTLDVPETGRTFAENARLKALAFAQASGLPALADDSGLEVEALGGAPGLYSARYAGPGAADADRRRKLLHELRHVPPPRPARFVCAVAVAVPVPGGEPRLAEFVGLCPGEIALQERGAGGFGYDPLFYLPDHGLTLAELPLSLKNQISHRARALRAAWPYLQTLLQT
jgi:XTP/dITP diphosphohydrolase